MMFKNIFKIVRTLAIFTFLVLLVISCKKPQNALGADFLDDQIFGTGIFRNSKLVTFTTQEKFVVGNTKTLNYIGAYRDPKLGSFKSGFAAQVSLPINAPSFGTNPVVDSVVLTIPYLARSVGDSLLIYDTDSIYGNLNTPMHLRIAELNKLLNPDSLYYSNINLPSSSTLFETSNFKPNFKAISVDGRTRYTLDSLVTFEHDRDGKIVDTIKRTAAFRVHLDKNFFQSRVIDMEGSAVLADNANFINYFNGLVFETNSSEGAVYAFNLLAGANLIIYYKNDDVDDQGELKGPQSFTLGFNAKYSRVNKFDIDRTTISDWGPNNDLYKQIVSFDTLNGSSKLYFQSSTGLNSSLKLFTDKAQLDSIRKLNWLINEANIVFRVSSDQGTDISAPNRMYIFNRDSVASSYPQIVDEVYESALFGGFKNLDYRSSSSERRIYKFRITNHVSDLLNGVRTKSSKGEDSLYFPPNFPIKIVPHLEMIGPSRLILNGNKASTLNINDKDLFLEIHYSTK